MLRTQLLFDIVAIFVRIQLHLFVSFIRIQLRLYSKVALYGTTKLFEEVSRHVADGYYKRLDHMVEENANTLAKSEDSEEMPDHSSALIANETKSFYRERNAIFNL